MSDLPREVRPGAKEYAPFYSGYVGLVPEGDIVRTLTDIHWETVRSFQSVGAGRDDFRYAPDRWSIVEVVGHLIDTERLFSFRALHIGRGDGAALPGMDQDSWARESGATERPLEAHLDEWTAVRAATIHLFDRLPDAAWDRYGTASDAQVTVRALAWMIAGHELHHRALLLDRYRDPTR